MSTKFLIDTCVFIELICEPSKLDKSIYDLMLDLHTQGFISTLSFYEIAYKYRYTPLPNFDLQKMQFYTRYLSLSSLPPQTICAQNAGKSSWTHKDPFDRLIAHQALNNELTLITSDHYLLENMPPNNILSSR